ncbi:hypothetical protein [Streptomyces sp. NPDC048641]
MAGTGQCLQQRLHGVSSGQQPGEVGELSDTGAGALEGLLGVKSMRAEAM